jgi:hypothetical protein
MSNQPEHDDDEEGEGEPLSLDDVIDMMEDLTEEVYTLTTKLESAERGITNMMTGVVVILGDVALALSPNATEAGRAAATLRVEKVVGAMRAQMAPPATGA